MIHWVLLGILIPLLYLWFVKPLVCYLLAVMAFGSSEVILIYRPFTSNIKYMKYRNSVDGDSLLEIKKKLQQQPDAKIIIYGYMFYCLQNVIDPHYIKRITSTQFIHNVEKMKFIFGDQYQKNLVFSDDKIWKNSRRIISNVFHFEQLKSQQDTINRILQDQIKGLENKEVNLYELACKITGKVVIQTMVGKQFENIPFGELSCLEEAVEISKLMVVYTMKPTNMIRYLITRRYTPPSFLQSAEQKILYSRFQNFKQKGREYLQQQYNRVKNGQPSNSKFLDVYMKQANPEEYFDQIIQQFLIFLFAGQDTTGNLIESCLAYLAQYPQYQSKILQQFQSNKNIHTLNQLNHFINEVNRLYGPARNLLIRKVTKPFNIDNYTFAKGSYLTLGIGFVMYSPKYFDDPLEFIPERWEKIHEDAAFIPFSSGPKNCIGQHLAKIQVRMILMEILKKYKLKRTNTPISLLSIGNVFYGKTYHDLVKFQLR